MVSTNDASCVIINWNNSSQSCPKVKRRPKKYVLKRGHLKAGIIDYQKWMQHSLQNSVSNSFLQIDVTNKILIRTPSLDEESECKEPKQHHNRHNPNLGVCHACIFSVPVQLSVVYQEESKFGLNHQTNTLVSTATTPTWSVCHVHIFWTSRRIQFCTRKSLNLEKSLKAFFLFFVKYNVCMKQS